MPLPNNYYIIMTLFFSHRRGKCAVARTPWVKELFLGHFTTAVFPQRAHNCVSALLKFNHGHAGHVMLALLHTEGDKWLYFPVKAEVCAGIHPAPVWATSAPDLFDLINTEETVVPFKSAPATVPAPVPARTRTAMRMQAINSHLRPAGIHKKKTIRHQQNLNPRGKLFEIECIVDLKFVEGVLHFKVKWMGYPDVEWIPSGNAAKQTLLPNGLIYEWVRGALATNPTSARVKAAALELGCHQ